MPPPEKVGNDLEPKLELGQMPVIQPGEFWLQIGPRSSGMQKLACAIMEARYKDGQNNGSHVFSNIPLVGMIEGKKFERFTMVNTFLGLFTDLSKLDSFENVVIALDHMEWFWYQDHSGPFSTDFVRVIDAMLDAKISILFRFQAMSDLPKVLRQDWDNQVGMITTILSRNPKRMQDLEDRVKQRDPAFVFVDRFEWAHPSVVVAPKPEVLVPIATVVPHPPRLGGEAKCPFSFHNLLELSEGRTFKEGLAIYLHDYAEQQAKMELMMKQSVRVLEKIGLTGENVLRELSDEKPKRSRTVTEKRRPRRPKTN